MNTLLWNICCMPNCTDKFQNMITGFGANFEDIKDNLETFLKTKLNDIKVKEGTLKYKSKKLLP